MPVSNQPRIVIFTGSSCPRCNRVKQYLKEKGFRFREVNVERGRGDEIEFAGEKYLIVSRSDSLAVIK